MSIRKAIYDLLNDTESDVYPLIATQELTDPYVAYNMNMSAIRTQEGIGVTDVDLTLNIFANKLSDCISLADTMYAALENASGTYATETLMVCNWTGESDNYLEGLDKYLITQDYQLRFT